MARATQAALSRLSEAEGLETVSQFGPRACSRSDWQSFHLFFTEGSQDDRTRAVESRLQSLGLELTVVATRGEPGKAGVGRVYLGDRVLAQSPEFVDAVALHEASHVEHRDYLRTSTRGTWVALLQEAATIDPAYQDLCRWAVDAHLATCRNEEHRADSESVQGMRALGHSPQKIAQTWEALLSWSDSGGVEEHSTHPQARPRLERIRAQLNLNP